MFGHLEGINWRPEPFEYYTAADLWTDEHISAQMLAYHLDPQIDVSSRRVEFIDESVAWIGRRFGVVEGTRIADFGCGPGLYANRLAKRGASVTGIDFSKRSVEYARAVAAEEELTAAYECQDYLEFEAQGLEAEARFDVILMVYCDFCALSPTQRVTMLEKFHALLAPGGSVLLDVYSLSTFEQREEVVSYEENLLGGFWSPEKHYAFRNTFKYDDEKVVLDKYTIVEAERTRAIYNWHQCFSPASLQSEFERAGLAQQQLYGNVAGAPFDEVASEFAVVAKRA